MKRFLSLFMASMLCFMSCYDDSEIRESLQDHEKRIVNLELLCNRMNTNITSMQALLEAVQNNDYVKSVTPVMENGKEVGYTITFAKSTPITIYHGKDGKDGKPGADGRPGTDGKPGQPGADGKPGRPGADGQDGRPGVEGHSPVIGVRLDTDGIYYWTLDGSWLLDDNGNKIKAIGTDGNDGQNGSDGQDGKPGTDGKPGADGITPRLRIIEGYWEISYDNGTEWTRLGKATGENGQNGSDGQNGDSMFQSITNAETTVTFVLSSGETIVLPKERSKELTITFDDFDIGILPSGTSRVGYTIQGGSEKNIVRTLVQGGWRAEVQKTTNTRGEIIVTAPDPLNTEEIAVLVSDGNGPAIMSAINFVTGVISPSVEVLEAPIEGGYFDIDVETNIDYTVCIPERDKSWISIAPQTKSIRTDKVTFVLEENMETDRTSKIVIKALSGEMIKSLEIMQKGRIVPMIVTVNGVNIPLIKVDGGTFDMGETPEQGTSTDDWAKPVHQVTLSDYYIGQTEVTQELWEAVIGTYPDNQTGNPKCPIENFKWNDIVNEFLPKLNELTGKTFSLPTEAQWEFAARGGIKSQGYKYSGGNNIDEVAWYVRNSNNETHPVAQKYSNELGLYDMSGNVREWCSDWFGKYSAEAQTDPTGPTYGKSRVFRGGNYSQFEDCSVSNRFGFRPDYPYSELGFRLVLSDNIYLNEASLKLVEGQSKRLIAGPNGIVSLTHGLTWTSSNPTVARVDSNGKVTAAGVGISVINVKVNETGQELSCNVEVYPLVKPSMIVTVNGVEIPLIKVDGGTFTMGATPEQGTDATVDEKPAHEVTLSDYYIGQYEVTQELWEAVMGTYPSYNANNPKFPVERVSWNMIRTFISELNTLTGRKFRLPTEAQWEFAARGGNKSKGYKYSGSNTLVDVAWFTENSYETHRVGQKIPNELGIYDMSGNVQEWCYDVVSDYIAEPQTNPTGPLGNSKSHRVMRGGGIERGDCRVSARALNAGFPNNQGYDYGFRLALVL